MQLPEDATVRAPLALVVGMAGWGHGPVLLSLLLLLFFTSSTVAILSRAPSR